MEDRIKNIAFYIQARTGSTRLPNKILLAFENENSILDIIVDKIATNFPDIPIVVCTTINVSDNKIEELCIRKSISYFRGCESNVLNRFLEASEKFNTDVIIRICADNPFLDIGFLNELIEFYKSNIYADYWSFKNCNNVPVIKMHYGFFAEIVTKEALRKVSQLTTEAYYLEHVTNYIYSHTGFICILKSLPDFLNRREDLRFTIDDNEDFKILQDVYKFHKENSYEIRKTISHVDKIKYISDAMMRNIKKHSK
jgi:spore coat polysaccharide biosynthesis protein SpsF